MKAKDYYVLMESIFYENKNTIKDALKENPEIEKQIASIIDDKKNIKINNFFKVLMNKNFRKFFKKFKKNQDFINFLNSNKNKIEESFFPKEGEKIMINEGAVLFFSVQAIIFLFFVLINAFEININVAVVLQKISNFIKSKIKLF